MWRLVGSWIRMIIDRNKAVRRYFGGEIIPYRDEVPLKRGRLFY